MNIRRGYTFASAVFERAQRLFATPSDNDNPIDTMRAMVAVLMSMIGIIFAVGFGIGRLLGGQTVWGSIDLLTAIFLNINLFLSRTIRLRDTWHRFSVYMITAYFLFIFLRAEYQGATLWALTIPLLASYILGIRRGLLVTGGSFVFILCYFFFTGSTSYSVQFQIRYTGVFILLTVLSNAYGIVQTLVVDKLRQESKNAQQASRAKSVFLGTMSDEIRTPLNGIIGMNNLVLETMLTPEQRDYIDHSQASAETLVTFVNNLLDFSRLETGTLTINEVPFDIRTIVEDVMDTIAVRAVGREIDLYTFIHPTMPETITGDPARVRQILDNLAGNAVKFTEKGDVAVSITIENDADGRMSTRFEISDTGIGIDPSRYGTIFSPFSRFAPAAGDQGGTGLGLALSKRLVELMGGTIGFTSTDCKGSTFWFSIPLKTSAAASSAQASDDALREMKILIVDQSPNGRNVTRQYLQAAGCQCTVVEQPDEAHHELERTNGDPSKRFDTMIVAVPQPGNAGFQQVLRIKIDAMLKSIPLVLITAAGSRYDAQKQRDAGVAACLTRPLKKYQLIETLKIIRHETHSFANADTQPIRVPVAASSAETRKHKAMRILVAEDNAVSRKVVAKFLEKAGYECEFAENGNEAVEAFRHKKYDFILMDCLMPELNGYDAVYAIRHDEARPDTARHIPICAMTAGSTPDERRKCLDAGMDDYIIKPLVQADFIALIEKWERRLSTPGYVSPGFSDKG